MEFAKGLASSAGTSARSKFRARGQPAKETAMDEPESGPMELLVKRPATSSSSPPARKPAASKPATGQIESLPIRLPENERIKRYMDMASSMANGHNVP